MSNLRTSNHALIPYIILLLNLSYSTSYSQAGWFLQQSGTTNDISSVFFVNENTGFVVGEGGTMLRTTNSGTNWILLTPLTSQFLNDISFFDTITGLVAGDFGSIYKTTSGGSSWTSQSCNCSGDLFSASLVSPTTGFITSYGRIYRTTNGGVNWNAWLAPDNGVLAEISFVDANTGIVVGSLFNPSISFIYKTTNSGVNWVTVYYANTGELNDIVYIDNNTATAVGDFDLILRTTNGGQNWIQQYSGTTNAGLRSAAFSSADTGTIVGSSGVGPLGIILRTTDGGANWQFQTSPSDNALRDTYFLNSNTGWAVGNNGTIIKTTTGGVIYIEPISSEVPDKFLLYQNYPNPFNPATSIRFDIPKTSSAKLILYDIRGREIAVLVEETLKPGTYEIEFDISRYMPAASGVYFYRLVTDEFSFTRKMILIQ